MDTTARTSTATATATAALASVPQSQSPPTLLREWTYHDSNNNNSNIRTGEAESSETTTRTTAATATVTSSSTSTSTSLEEASVPVAPAVVLPSSGLRYNYPVATFVSNLVRQYGGESFAAHATTTVLTNDNQNDRLHQNGNTPQHERDQNRDHNHLRSNHNLNDQPPQQLQRQGRATLEEAEYLIVDGDLIVVPSHSTTTSTSNNTSTSSYNTSGVADPEQNTATTTREFSDQDPLLDPQSRKHRFKLKPSLKGIRKWIKKRATRVVYDEPNLAPPSSASTPTASAATATAPVTSSAASLPPPLQPSPPRTSSAQPVGASKKKSAKVQRRRTWNTSRSEAPLSDEEDPRNSTAAVASLSAPLDFQSQSSDALSQGFLDFGLATSSLQHQQLDRGRYHDALASFPPDHHSDRHLHPMLAPTVIDEAAIVSSDDNSAAAAVNALFVGNVEQVLESGVLTNVAPAVAFVESDKNDDYYWYKKDNEKMLQEEITLDSMLQLARHESSSEEEEILESTITAVDNTPTMKRPPRPKVDDDTDDRFSKPLSEATTLDAHVWNDTLKVLLVGSGGAADKSALGRALAGKRPKRPKQQQSQYCYYDSQLGVDVHTWTCRPEGLRFSLWDVHSQHAAGKHPATQSLFFSANTLYILLWDLGVRTVSTTATTKYAGLSGTQTVIPSSARRMMKMMDEEGEDDDEDEDDDDDFMLEESIRAADRALELDISDHVLSWLDPMAYGGAAILPVVIVSDACSGLSQTEIERRCSMLQSLLMEHPAFKGVGAPHLIFGDRDSIVRVVLDTGEGVPELQEMIHAIGKEKVFPHIGTSVDPIIVEVNQTIRRLKKDHKVILLDHLMSEIKSRLEVEQVQDALDFLSSIGEILYYGNSTDEVLSRFVILSRKWLVSALSCILRPDLQRELDETRRFMNLQCVYSGEAFNESDVVQTLLQGTNSSCPILSAKDSAMLWKSMSFMREAADRTAQLSEASTTMYDFLERLLVYSGIFMPLTVSAEPTYFVPSLLDTAAAAGVWTYKSSESWMTTLCHSWLLRDGAPSNIMEHVTTSLLQDLYEFSHTFQGATVKHIQHPKMYPLGAHSMAEFMDSHDHQAIGRIKIHQVVCWKSCLLVKIGTVFADAGQKELRESFTEIFVALVDEQSEYCVATRSMTNSMKRLIVCGKGQVGHGGRKLWQGGFSLVLDSLKASLADATGCRREVVCPECLAHAHPSVAGTWSWDTVQAANETGNAGVRCTRGHLVDTNLLCGVCSTSSKLLPPEAHIHPPRHRRAVSKLLHSVVVVALWDVHAQEIRSVGSGFIVDKKLGLIVTAGHILFDMAPGRNFGTPYLGFPNAKVLIGVIDADGRHKAVFRYFAEILAHDIRNVDACVLRITTKLENDVDGEDCGSQTEVPLNNNVRNERLPQLRMTRTFELEETVRILGFNQGGEGVLEQGKHVNRCADFAKGYICKRFTNMGSDDSSTSSKGSSSSLSLSGGSGSGGRKESTSTSTTAISGCSTSIGACFVPREEIVVMCPTISGHSGGPCVNDEGRVVGILSRADSVDRQRCYLVPTTEIKDLVNKAKVVLESFPS